MARPTTGRRIPRRAVVAGLLATPFAARAGDGDDPRVGGFDIGTGDDGAGDDGWRIILGRPAVPPPPRGYGAIVALDGGATFPKFRRLMPADAPVLLAGVSYTGANRRWRDMTSLALAPVNPAVPAWSAPKDSVTGERDLFLTMIATRLLPELHRLCPLDADDLTLFGHSLGGLFVLHALFAQPRLFARYVAADPSTWWNAGEAAREAAAFAGGVRAAGGALTPRRRLLLTRARWVGQGGHVGGVLIDPILRRRLEAVPGLDFDYRLYPAESHGSIVAPTMARTLAMHGIAAQ